MHENRETSVAPDVAAGRSGKAHGRTPDMHAAEESDSGIVPMNQPNKGGRPPAEVGEGRVEIKENIAQSHTRPTLSGASVSQGLSGVPPHSTQIIRDHGRVAGRICIFDTNKANKWFVYLYFQK
jgi:hypothetical protein